MTTFELISERVKQHNYSCYDAEKIINQYFVEICAEIDKLKKDTL